MSNFKEYPKLMKHPQHAAPVMRKMEGKGVGLFEPDTICTSPEKFPDVTVMTLEQEQYYAARGYRPNNMGSPEEYEQAILESAPVDGYAFKAYPKWKYHAFELPKIVKSAQEETELGDDWGDSPIIATEDDVIEPFRPAATAVKPQKEPKKIDGRTKEYKAQHA